jgi:NTE family protein
LFQLSENPNTTFLKFAVHYDGLYKTAALVNITQKKTLFKNDITSLDLILGDNLRYNLDYYVDNGFYWSFGFKSRFNQFNRNLQTDFNNGALLNQLGVESINIDFSDWTNQAYLQTIFIQKFLIGGGIEFKHLKIKSRTIGNSNSVFDNSNYASVFAYLKYDSLDNKYFPKTGWFVGADFQTYLYSSDYTNSFNRYSIAKVDIGLARTLFKKTTMKFESEAGFGLGKESVHFFDFVLGGYGFNAINNFKPFYGYDFLSLSGDSYIKTTMTLDYELFKKNHLNLSANYANIHDDLFDTTKWFSKISHTGYAVGYGLESILGPIEFKYSWSPELGKGFAWFSVGFWF